MRKSRSNGSATYTYTYNGSKLTQMVKGTDTLYFTYDAFGAPWTVRWNGTVYTYMTNLQGDVIAIVNTGNVAVVEYTYDAWGNILSVTGTMADTLGESNPLRYRGYVYDYEYGLYYLQSRYYNPEWGRFLNADALVATGQGLLGNNMFAYCGNNPVNRVDSTGEAWYQWTLRTALADDCGIATGVTHGGFATAAATVRGTAVLSAVLNSTRVQDFSTQGDEETSTAPTGDATLVRISRHSLAKQSTSRSLSADTFLTIGTGSPSNNIIPNGAYTKLDYTGGLYSYTQFDAYGRQIIRFDFQGRPHAGVLPHIHVYSYPERGGKTEQVYDLMWNLID